MVFDILEKIQDHMKHSNKMLHKLDVIDNNHDHIISINCIVNTYHNYISNQKEETKQVKHDTSFLNNYKNLPEHIRLYLHEHPNSMRVSIEDNQAYYLKYKTQYDPKYKLRGE